MNIILHLMFALTVRKRLKHSLGVKINLPGFLYGNILPDISRKYGAHPHYMKDALAHVDRSKDVLISRKKHTRYGFAKELGAINHYLSDFFCLPHTEGYNGSKAHHGLYELIMIAKYKKGLRSFRSLLREHKTLINPHELRAFIVEHNNTYRRRKASKVNDIRYALFAGSKLGESLLSYLIAIPGFQESSLKLTHSFQTLKLTHSFQ